MKIKIEKVKIFSNEKGCSMSVGNKKEDGTWENMFVPVTFKKGTEIEDKAEINILDGFMTFYVNKDSIKVLKIVVMQFEYANGYRNSKSEKVEDTGEYITIDNTADLPF